MKQFLQQVAEHYAATPSLEDFCFVFPNRRSGKFFEQRLSEVINGPAMMPRIMAMADFLSDITSHNPVGDMESMLILYQAYREVMGDQAAPMDTFVFWANLIINDFNDADMNLVDVKQLYSNLSNIRDITTDYLDDDLKSAIERVLNINLPASSHDDRFWRESWQQQEKDGEVKREFFSLWEQMHNIYLRYHKLLEEQGLCTVGTIYRNATEQVKELANERLPLRVVMVGFSSLSVSEMSIFRTLKQRGIADFWWDNCLDKFSTDPSNPAGHLVNEYAKMFPMPAPLERVTLQNKKVEAVAVPSNIGQAKWAMDRVDQLVDQGQIPHPDNAINTAIVLPDESLFVPLMNSVSQKIKHFNVTMGYPLRHSNIVSLMHLVARAHKQATRSADNWVYYREYVKDIMSHPIIKSIFTREVMQVTQAIEERNEWNIPSDLLCRNGFSTLFTPLRDTSNKQEVIDYIDRLIAFCNKVSDSIKEKEPVVPKNVTDEHDDDANIKKLLPQQSAFIELYVEALEQLKLAFTIHGVPVTDDTLFYLIDRLTQTAVVPFEGEPLKGLQVMGLQETRSLDFENIIILSMNERVFPRRHGISSLIPDDLRAAFYMLTSSRQEAIAAYDFYRLISRADNIVLVYSNISSGIGSNEPSRFITQLKLLYGNEVKFTDYRVDTHPNSPSEHPILVKKIDAPMYDYVTPSASLDPDHAKCLSHSSIAEYMACQLKFYLHHVQHLPDNTDNGDFMDYGTFGTIIHDTLQVLYYPPLPNDKERQGTYRVTADMIQQFKKSQLSQEVQHQINQHYLHHDINQSITGEALILKETIETFVLRALDYDLKLLKDKGADYFDVLECEHQHSVQLAFSHNGVTTRFNFTYKPDRVDRIGDELRMVDYKTGKDPTAFSKIEDLFTSKNRRKAIAQLMLYCNAWQVEYPEDKLIHPVIYKLRKIDETGVFYKKDPFIYGANATIDTEFREMMGETIAQLLDRNGEFVQTDDTKPCQYCRFADFCRR